MFGKQDLITEIFIDRNEITHFLSFSLHQAFNAHHRFELKVEHGRLGMPGLISLENYREFVGKTLSVSFGHDQVNSQNFRGLVTDVSLSQSHGYQGVVVIKGYSSTVLIDRGKDLGSYHDRSLDDIVRQATREIQDHELYLQISPKRTKAIDYVIQYKESDFEFLNRLSAEYVEWFYYDGERINFGKPPELPQAKVVYGREVQKLDYGVHIAPVKLRRFSFLPQHDELIESDGGAKSNGNPDFSFAVERAQSTYNKVYSEPTRVRVDSIGELQEVVRAEEEASMAQLLRVSGESDCADVRLGGELEIETSIRQDLAFVTDTLGKFLITEVEHHFDHLGRYSNQFSGVQAGTERLPVPDYKIPNPEMQMADVIDNNDPLGQGRIRVRFKWRCGTNDDSEWLRVVTPNAGTGDRGVNRGFLAVPEIGDHVMVGFEEGHVSRPVVMGSLYHQKNIDSARMINNHLKTLTTRSGHLIEFDDDQGSQGIKITDIKGNILHIDSKGNNITLTALENMTLNCKNMQINVGENMDIQVGNDQNTSVGNNQSASVNNDISTTAGNNYSLSATGDIAESSDNRTEMASKDFLRQSDTSNELASEISVFSQQENMTLQSGKTVEVNSAEKSKIF